MKSLESGHGGRFSHSRWVKLFLAYSRIAINWKMLLIFSMVYSVLKMNIDCSKFGWVSNKLCYDKLLKICFWPARIGKSIPVQRLNFSHIILYAKCHNGIEILKQKFWFIMSPNKCIYLFSNKYDCKFWWHFDTWWLNLSESKFIYKSENNFKLALSKL